LPRTDLTGWVTAVPAAKIEIIGGGTPAVVRTAPLVAHPASSNENSIAAAARLTWFLTLPRSEAGD
jgi:hypothetical protein